MDRCALWNALCCTEASPFLFNLIDDLYKGTTSRVRVALPLSQPIETTSSVRQGCIPAPALFCIAIDWIFSRCVNSMGTTVDTSRLTDQDYTEDAALFTDNADKWPSILTNFNDASMTLLKRWVYTLRGRRQNFKILVVDCHHPLWTYRAIQLSLRTVSPIWAVKYTPLIVHPPRYSDWLALPRVRWAAWPQCVATVKAEY